MEIMGQKTGKYGRKICLEGSPWLSTQHPPPPKKNKIYIYIYLACELKFPHKMYLKCDKWFIYNKYIMRSEKKKIVGIFIKDCINVMVEIEIRGRRNEKITFQVKSRYYCILCINLLKVIVFHNIRV